MDVYVTRAEQLKNLINARSLTAVSDATGRSKSQLSDLTSGRRRMGEKLARAFEAKLELPSGYLDKNSESLAPQSCQYRVPLVSWESLLGETSEVNEVLMTTTKTSPDSFALRLMDSSMEPMISKGDDVIVDPGLQPQPADIVIAVADDRCMIGKYRARSKSAFEIVPINPDYAPVLSEEGNVAINGVVVEIRKFLKR